MKKSEAAIKNLFDLDHTMARSLFETYEYPWEVLDGIGEFILKIGPTLPEDEYYNPVENVWIHKTVKAYQTISITGPTIIGEGTELRPGAFVRGNVIAGRNCVMGNACEYKNCILFDEVQTPHYNYIGDSILGYKSHTGAQALTSNVKSDKKNVVIHFEDGDVETGRKKVGAMIGDHVEVGCSSVLNPGTIIGRNTNIYPLTSVRGTVPADSIVKNTSETVAKRV
ncbi:MAG: UDP-N-acetylglucosamine pyrophosphorylase [Lachnospiraceae bacterium]|nr:UDP-N-acetylglucosamine pyrophosphorylase [Lachnospiraceae bacterium]